MKNKKLYQLKMFLKRNIKLGAATGLLLASGFAAKAQNPFSQNPVWAFNGKKLSFTNGVGVLPTITGTTIPAGSIHNSYSDRNGNLIFYVEKIGTYTRIFKADGTWIGDLNQSQPYYGGLSIVPKPGSCSEVYIIYYSDVPSSTLYLRYNTLNTNTWALSSGNIIDPNVSLTAYQGGSIAVSKPLANGCHYMYGITNGAIFKYDITSTGIFPASNVGGAAGWTHSNQILPNKYGNKVYYIGSDYSSNNEISTDSYEAELSHDGTRLAWGTRFGSKVAYIKLNDQGNLAVVAGTQNPTENLVKIVTIQNISEGRINGLEFSPVDPHVIHITAGKDDATNLRNGVNTIDFNPWEEYPNTYSPFLIPATSSYEGSYQYAQSYIELAYNQRLIVAGTNDLRQIVINSNPTLSFSEYITGVTATVVNNNSTNNLPIRTLPSQLDGYHYKYTNMSGPSTATVGYPVAFSVPEILGANYVWRVNGILVQTGSSPTLNKTFTSGEVGTASIFVVIYDPYCGTTTFTKSVNVQCSGCTGDTGGGNGRLAYQGNTGIVLMPNLNQNILRMNLPSTDQVYEIYITDLKGSLVKKVSARAGAWELSSQDLVPGVYLLKAMGQKSAFMQKIIISK